MDFQALGGYFAGIGYGDWGGVGKAVEDAVAEFVATAAVFVGFIGEAEALEGSAGHAFEDGEAGWAGLVLAEDADVGALEVVE